MEFKSVNNGVSSENSDSARLISLWGGYGTNRDDYRKFIEYFESRGYVVLFDELFETQGAKDDGANPGREGFQEQG